MLGLVDAECLYGTRNLGVRRLRRARLTLRKKMPELAAPECLPTGHADARK